MAKLGDLERRVMDVLWASSEPDLTARAVEEQIPGYAYTTILTVLDRLKHKGFVVRSRDGRAHRYAAVGTRESHIAGLMHEALGVTSDPDAALVRFVQTVTPEEAAVLREALRQADAGADAP